MLLTPYEKGKLKLKNRLIMPPMTTVKSDDNGKISKEMLNYYDKKSKGGYISLIIVEHSYISKSGKAHNNQLSVASDEAIEDLKKLAEIIHENGTKAVMQINHCGSLVKKEINEAPFAPSAILNPRNPAGIVPKEMTKDEIKGIVNDFKSAALRVKNAGFDGVEIHSAHGYLLNQFISPLTNKRTDEYGVDVNGRIRIHLEIIKAVKEVVGEDYPILIRLGVTDEAEDGLTMEDAIYAAESFEKAGVDIIDISGGMSGFTLLGNKEPGYFQEQSKAIKNVVNIPVILTGGITEPSAAEKLLTEGKADFIGVGRAMFNDSTWAKKAIESLI